MDAMKNIGGWIQGNGDTLGKIASAGSGASGIIGNILAGRQRNKVLDQQMSMQQQIAAMTPEQLAENINRLQRPLSMGLQKGVGNIVQASMAERGLGQSPAIFSDILAQSLAPFYLQEQQRATSAYLQKLGLPLGAGPNPALLPQNTDNTNTWRMILDLFRRPTAAGTANTGGGSPVTSGNFSSNTWDATGSIPKDGDTGGFGQGWMDILNGAQTA